MKARIRPEKEVFLLYKLGEDTEKGKKLRQFLSAMNIETVTVTEEMLCESVGYCAGMEGFSVSGKVCDSQPLPYEMMVMKVSSRQRLNEILGAFSREPSLRVERKAVITPTNRDWPFRQLYEEVCREHEYMTARGGKQEE